MNFYFILVHPRVPENIGASARAIKTMGFKNLRIVKSSNNVGRGAWWMAHGARDVLENAVIYSDLNEAVRDVDLIIGTTSRKRTVRHHYYTCDELRELLEHKRGTVSSVALLFGSEDKGLTNRELKQCDIFSIIPMHDRFPSLNLSQAVMVYAYALFPVIHSDSGSRVAESADPGQLKSLKEKTNKVLQLIGYPPDSFTYWRLKERLGRLADKDVKLLHVLCNKVYDRLTKKSGSSSLG